MASYALRTTPHRLFDGWECYSHSQACEEGRETCHTCAWAVEEDWFDAAFDEEPLQEHRAQCQGAYSP